MSDDQINIEINGVPVKADKGLMLIEAADKAGVRIPRFCYHSKLSVAANCRMCLVEVEKAPKPLPACATPLMEGMKVFTKSPKALAAQKATMEFLLINHPLDCPICDQGGECELQDVAMGYGGDVSRYSEGKRVVPDKNLGALIATDMTRCIHCTRCVRFGQELAGIREMGATGRGEHTSIGTYIEQAVDSEMSGNVIDLCPVGALTAKPSRYSARAWELIQKPAVAAHDCMGSNTSVHSFRGAITRTVPRDNESINECWLSDRDRFSYEGVNSDARLTSPMIKINGKWKETDWDTALEVTAKGLKSSGADTGMLVSSSATLEEMSLTKLLADGLGSGNIDHRLRQQDFRDSSNAVKAPGLGQSIEDLEKLDAVLVIGSNIRKEQPIAAHRLRKASMSGAKLMFVNNRDFDFHFNVEEKIIASPHDLVKSLAGIAKAALTIAGNAPADNVKHIIANVDANDVQLTIAEHLNSADKATVILGSQVQLMPAMSDISILAATIADATGATFGCLTDGANTTGAYVVGVLPGQNGKNAQQMLSTALPGYLMMGVEADLDVANAHQAVETISKADFVVSLTAFDSESTRQYANVMLPVSTATETSGTYINVAGDQQSFAGAAQPQGDTRPAWKVLRVLGNLLDLDGFDYNSSEQVRDEVLAGAAGVDATASTHEAKLPEQVEGLTRIGGVATYQEDAVVRHAPSLQKTFDGNDNGVRIHSDLAAKLGLDGDTERVMVKQSGDGCSMTLTIDDGVPADCVWLPIAVTDSDKLDLLFATIELEAD